jgi:hypothetical protein
LISKQLFVGWEEDATFLAGLEKLMIVLDSDQMTRCSCDARSIGDETEVEKLRVEVEEKIATMQRPKAGIEVSVVHEDELLPKTFFLENSKTFSRRDDDLISLSLLIRHKFL